MKKNLGLAIATCMGLLATSATAATFTYSGTFNKNECAGQGGFDHCTLDGSPTVAKFKYKKGVQVKTRLNNVVFPSIDGGEFSILQATNKRGKKSKRRGTWSYSATLDDPMNITAFVVKAGKQHAVYTWDTDSGSDFSNIQWNSRKMDKKRMKHITFFDTGSKVSRDGPLPNKPQLPNEPQLPVEQPSPVPVPAAGFLLIAGLGGLAGLRRRRKS